MKTKRILTILMMLLISFVLFNNISCNKEEEYVVENEIFITVDNTTKLPYEVVAVYVEGIALTANEYNGSLDDMNIVLVKAGDDDNLVFSIPNTPEGNYVLTVTINEELLSTEINIGKHTIIENPSEYISKKNHSISIDVNQLSDTIIKYNPDNNELIAYASDMKTILTETNEYLSTLSEEEQKELAYILEANKEMFDLMTEAGSLMANYNLKKSNQTNDCIDLKFDYLTFKRQFENNPTQLNYDTYINAKIKYEKCIPQKNTESLEKGTKSLTKFEQFKASNGMNGSLTGAIKGLFAAAKLYIANSYPNIYKIERGDESVLGSSKVKDLKIKPVSSAFSIDELKKTEGKITFYNKKPTLLNAQTTFRNFQEEDINSEYSLLSEYCNAFKNFSNKITEVNVNMEKPFQFDGSFSQEQTETIPLSINYSVENISSEAVILEDFKIVEGQLSIQFSTDESEDIDFTFDIVYNDPETGSHTTNMSASLVISPSAYSVEIFSGNEQTGKINEKLANPIQVLVKDSEGNSLEGVSVNFSVTEGSLFIDGGSNGTGKTHANGIAETEWTLGSTEGEQTLTVNVFKADGTTHIQGSPLSFIANAEKCIVLTVDGYETIQIGNQIWMARNLDIPSGIYAPDMDSWDNLSYTDNSIVYYNPGYCYYKDDPSMREKYGLLYNYTAALNACPAGWHLPTIEEFEELCSNYYNFGNYDSEALKSDSEWNGTNKSCFGAVPSGYRYSGYYFEDEGHKTYFWCAWQDGHSPAYLKIDDNNVTLEMSYSSSRGYSVRCIKD